MIEPFPAQRLHCGRHPAVEIDAKFNAAPADGFHDEISLFVMHCHRLFTKDMLSRLCRRFNDGQMRFMCRGNLDHVHFGIVDDLHEIGCRFGDMKLFRRSFCIVRVHVTRPFQCDIRMFCHIRKILAPGEFAASDLGGS